MQALKMQKFAIRLFTTAARAEEFANKLAKKAAITQISVLPFQAKPATRFLVVARFVE